LATLIIANSLGPDDFGLIAYASAIVAIIQVLCNYGFEQSLVPQICLSSANANQLIINAFKFKVVNGGFIYLAVVVWAIANWKANASLSLILSIIGMSVVFNSADVMEMYFQAFEKNSISSYYKILSYIFGFLLKITIIVAGFGIHSYAIAIAVESSVLSLLYGKDIAKISKSVSGTPFVKYYLQTLKRNLPIAISNIFVIMYMRLDVVILKMFVTKSVLGVYSLANLVAGIWTAIPMVIASLITSKLVSLRMKDKEMFDRFIQDLYQVSNFLTIVIWIICVLMSMILEKYLLKNEYTGFAKISAVLMANNIWCCSGVINSICLNIEGQRARILVKTGIGLVVAIVLHLLLIPKFGGIGAAIALTVSFYISAIGVNLFSDPEVFAQQMKVRLNIWDCWMRMNNALKQGFVETK
jgi:O-antigen/teichoic acid export membrane protein